jgi:GNAT superfamily N-acetyltransferase
MNMHDYPKAALRELCHLNLIEFARESARWSGGCTTESAGILAYRVRAAHAPLLSGVHRTDPRASAEEAVRRGFELDGQLSRGWSIWARASNPRDRDLIEAASNAGLHAWPRVPAMVLLARDLSQPLAGDLSQLAPEDITIRPATVEQDIEDFWQVNTRAYSDSGYADDLVSLFGDGHTMLAPHIRVVVARDREGSPIGAALALLSHGVAGVYWVGTTAAARRRGVGSACTASVTRAALTSGANAIFLHSSRSGYGVYRSLGFRDLDEYMILSHLSDNPIAEA